MMLRRLVAALTAALVLSTVAAMETAPIAEAHGVTYYQTQLHPWAMWGGRRYCKAYSLGNIVYGGPSWACDRAWSGARAIVNVYRSSWWSPTWHGHF